jgi:hypothetical protein
MHDQMTATVKTGNGKEPEYNKVQVLWGYVGK